MGKAYRFNEDREKFTAPWCRTIQKTSEFIQGCSTLYSEFHLATVSRNLRRNEEHVLLFSIFAIVSGANSYRGIRTFIKVHRPQLNRAFKIRWKRPPAHTAIRYILQGLSPADVENVFRQHAADLNHAGSGPGTHVVAFDGKALKGSFDNFNDVKAKQVLSAFAVNTALVLAHIEIDEKSNEIPAVQKLLEELDVAGHIVTCDAMHCQKKPSKPPPPRTHI